jgi:uncharacterized membrane protein YeaQ/YmgE (transglycosylase-associated protein family)
MPILIWILFGALVGWIASMIAGIENNLLSNILIGIAGAVVGGFVMRMFGQSQISGFNPYSILVAILGACVLIALVKSLRKQ